MTRISTTRSLALGGAALRALALGALITAAPGLDPVDRGAGAAWAKGGDDGDRGGDDGDRGGDDGDRGGDDGDRGGDDSDSDGDSDDRDRDDDDDDDASRADDGDRASDDRGRGRGRDDRAARGVDGPKAEFGPNGAIEVTFADGTKREIENGKLEVKDAFGRTVVERPATAADRADLEAAAAAIGAGRDGGGASGSGAGSAGAGLGGGVAKGEVSPAGAIEVTWRDGWKEEIEGGRYEAKNPAGRTVVERAATPADAERLRAALRY